MSFYPQPNNYQCGPFALKYALAVLGIFKNEDQIGISAESTWWAGTDEIGLTQAARKFNCELKYFYSDLASLAIKMLNKQLKNRYPCILSVNNWEHWIVVINRTKDKYVIVDSGKTKVISSISQKKMVKMWRYHDREENYSSFDGYTLKPKFNNIYRAKFSAALARELMYKKNESLARLWDQYFNDLIALFEAKKNSSNNYISAKEFFRRNQNLIIKNVADWHGEPSYEELEKIVGNMKFVASVYDLVLSKTKEKKAIVDLTSLLMMHVCGKYGMYKIY